MCVKYLEFAQKMALLNSVSALAFSRKKHNILHCTFYWSVQWIWDVHGTWVYEIIILCSMTNYVLPASIIVRGMAVVMIPYERMLYSATEVAWTGSRSPWIMQSVVVWEVRQGAGYEMVMLDTETEIRGEGICSIAHHDNTTTSSDYRSPMTVVRGAVHCTLPKRVPFEWRKWRMFS